jgi:hypothetical protein
VRPEVAGDSKFFLTQNYSVLVCVTNRNLLTQKSGGDLHVLTHESLRVMLHSSAGYDPSNPRRASQFDLLINNGSKRR